MNRTHSPKPSARGFTLVEIIAVLAVIATIIAIGVPSISKVLQSGRIRNVEGSASVVRSALTQYLSKPDSVGTIPVTEGTIPAYEYVSSDTVLTNSNIAGGATLDGILLAEGVLDRPLSIRMGQQGTAVSGLAPIWTPSQAQFTGPGGGTLANYSPVSRVECAVSDGVNNPGTTGQAAGSAACAFNLAGNSTPIPSGTRVAYIIIKGVPDSDAFQLALDVDGPSLVQNTVASPAGADQNIGVVVYARDATSAGYVDVYFYLTSL